MGDVWNILRVPQNTVVFGYYEHNCGCVFLKSQSKSATLNFGSILFVFHTLMALIIKYCGGAVMMSDVMYMGVPFHSVTFDVTSKR